MLDVSIERLLKQNKDFVIDRSKPALARIQYENLRKQFSEIDRPLSNIEELHLETDTHKIPMRAYIPENVNEKSSTLVFYHGGGWVLGNIETVDYLCRYLAYESVLGRSP
ncbi:alpha/beta hydrolase [Geomicrobium sp. JCM 19055]|uniref:alpha/beta hydrolase n=1 Tax=Geomicrobium sp. JCM 19055 TaxID=1460649 RepID=UPI00045ED39C|nr:alpha/beta hydrolase fold domain-containing protein [Geomicrobium sp. JCM 19055]GAJ97375.1 hypothetical protein JCM19055_230 [Geomicrobium sp. JCM 19055]